MSSFPFVPITSTQRSTSTFSSPDETCAHGAVCWKTFARLLAGSEWLDYVHRSLLLNHRSVEKIDMEAREHVVVMSKDHHIGNPDQTGIAPLRKALQGSGLV
ncbi:MAG TPA: hypothetical protein VGC39_09105 [Candidatus Methylacidiphilales bacterium]